MPQHSRAKWAELRVGIMAAVALALLAYLIILLSGSTGLFESDSNVFTYLGDSGDLADGAPLRLNGIVVGKVRKVELSGSNDPQRVIKIDLEIQNKYLSSIPVDSVAQISAGNLLGTKYINITKGKSPETIKANAELKSADVAEFQDVVRQSYSAVAALQGILTKLDGLLTQVQSGEGTIGKFLVDPTLYDKAVGVVNEGNKLLLTLNSNKGSIGKLLNDDDMANQLHETMGRFNSLLEGLQQGQGTAGKLLKDPAMYNDAQATIADLRKTIAQGTQLLADINAGKGSAGKLLKTDDLANQLHDTIARLDSLLDKVNNGQGTIGQLLVNPSLYESLDGTSREITGLLKDFRSNPKKFLHIKIGLF
ncbi:MAG TPA: MlaD family protein [Bryobacteraceae bacterium]|nr:MlaD family protein [Bryobacteraceae bacterium]